MTRTRTLIQTLTEAPGQGTPPPQQSESPALLALARRARVPHVAHFATRAASLVPPSESLDPLEALLASHPGASLFSQLLRATTLLCSELDAWQRGLALPLSGALRSLRDRKGSPRSEVLGYVYNPGNYARESFARYLEAYGPRQRLDRLLVGLNAGPSGMTQTGMPLIDPFTANTLGLTGQVTTPSGTHPRVPVVGFDSEKQEGSATAVSALMCNRWGSVANYYGRGFVMNFCPLLLLDTDGQNVTPADLRISHPAMRHLRDLCDAYLACVIWLYRPMWAITLGRYTEKRLARVLRLTQLRGTIETPALPHPSDLARHSWSSEYPSWEAYANAWLPQTDVSWHWSGKARAGTP